MNLGVLAFASFTPFFCLFLYIATRANIKAQKLPWRIQTIDLPLTIIYGLFLTFVFLTFLSAPFFLDSLSPTHQDVTTHKDNMRNLCTDYKQESNPELRTLLLTPLTDLDPSFSPSSPHDDLSMARKIVGNNIIGKTLSRLHQSSTALSSFGNSLISTYGPLLPIFPFLFFSLSYLIAPLRPFFSEPPQNFLPVRLSLSVAIGFGCLINFILFNYFLDRLRAIWCVHISGHWYTYTVTTFVFLTAFTHLTHHRPPPSFLPSFYLIYALLYQYLALFCCLSETQQFFHDQTDAQTGVWCGCVVGIPMFILSFWMANKVILWANGENQKGKEE